MTELNIARPLVAPNVEQSRAVASSPSTPRSLYVKREKLYPKAVKGVYRRLKWIALFVLLGIYYIVPWLRWERGVGQPDQAVLIDFENARFYFFFIEIWPQEVYYITGLLILAALGLFLATSLFGRVWCGFACPQTIWTDLFIAVERFFEGDRNARMRRDKKPWSFDKLWRKSAKHVTWIIVAAATGGAWILYFHDAPTIARDFLTGHAPTTSYVFAALLTFTTYWLAGHMREQVCTYMCPWPRIQAALIDDEALNVTYRYDRGEPRGSLKKSAAFAKKGDCIDCRQCIAVCPVGIDIRNGPQLECIGCGLCIDACNAVMDKVERPKWLIAFDTDKNVQRRLAGEAPKYRLIRARTISYALIIAAIAAFMLGALANRSELDLSVTRDRNPNFVRLSDGGVRNGYTLKVLNKASEPRQMIVSFVGLAEEAMPALSMAGRPDMTEMRIDVPIDDTRDFKIYLAVDNPGLLNTRTDFFFQVRDLETDETSQERAVFISGDSK
jgi:cytochrome c oxidase accessory protein FixG